MHSSSDRIFSAFAHNPQIHTKMLRDGISQGCRLGLERLGLEAVSRRFLERLGLVSVSRVWKNRTPRSWLGLEGSTSRSRLGLETLNK